MTIEFLLTIGVVLILILVGIIFFVPSEKKGRGKKKKVQESEGQPQKDLEEKAERLEARVKTLTEEIREMEKVIKLKEKETLIERVKVKKFEEKLSQEREWHRKEQEAIDRQGKDFLDLKEELMQAQDHFAQEHAKNIRLEQDLKEMKQQNTLLNDQRREAEAENIHLRAKTDNDRKEILKLKGEVAELSQKKEDVQWIARSEYDTVLRSLREKEKELQRMERERQK
jgi:hypothetical protein